LPPLLRLRGITTIPEANRWLSEVYLAEHNARFAVAAAEEGTAFLPYVGELDNILCVEEERVAGRDNTVRYAGHCLQIPASRDRHHFAKATIRVLEYGDGAIALFHRPLPCRRKPERSPNGQERVSRVSSLRDRPMDGVDSFGTTQKRRPSYRQQQSRMGSRRTRQIDPMPDKSTRAAHLLGRRLFQRWRRYDTTVPDPSLDDFGYSLIPCGRGV